MQLPQFDSKLIVVGVLLLVLIVARLLARKPMNEPVRRARRFGHRGCESPLRRAAAAPATAEANQGEPAPARDPEREFFGDGG